MRPTLFRHIRETFFITAWLCLVFALLSGCVEDELVVDKAQVTAEPSKDEQTLPLLTVLEKKDFYHQKEVAVFGKVSAGLAFEFVSEQPYLLEHKGAKLWVVTSDVLPADGSWVTVQGTVMAPYQVKGRHYDVVLLERKRGQ